MTKLIEHERPLLILPELAADIGLKEAVVLQQIYYWTSKNKHVIDGKSWVYNTYEDWQKQFPFWSVATITRTLKSLEKQGLIQTGCFNTMAFDQTKWYAVCLDAISQFARAEPSDSRMDPVKLNSPIPENNQQKITTADSFSFWGERARFEERLGRKKVEEAFLIAGEKGITSWSYIRKILLNWEEEYRSKGSHWH
ncbi:hypothetical protein [Domibacillus robiginosus]|uniref:hypothetical protein n=1 Tax=Domibacillus robiginosus TaxID=1071054 RepID=UPI00067DBD6E|nr:hypothetical protein [Domibacillus robiginosus]